MSDFRTEIRQMIDQLALGEEEIGNWVRKSKTIESVLRIPGDASTRRYYRVLAGEASYIVMRMEPFSEVKDSLPFLVVQKHLADAGVDVPAVIDVDSDRGFILLEDLGDDTLLRRLQEVGSSEVERGIYERVIDRLVHLQWHASPAQKPAQIDAYKLRFDVEKLMWEMNFTIEHFYLTYLKRQVKDKDLELMREALGGICKTLADEPTVLCHRDFHSRNVMCKGERLSMIDFQDARLGPAQYDLASLLKDSYYQLEESQISALLDYYITVWGKISGQSLDKAHFRRIFDLMSVQRNFKAIGSFASFLNRRGDAAYIKYIGNTFENIRRTLLKYPEYAQLRETLFHYYYF